MSGSNDLGQWYKSIPPITRVWFTASIVVPLAIALGILNSFHLVIYGNSIIQYFVIFMAVFMHGLNFEYLVKLYFLYKYSSRLETSTFNDRPADYVFCLTFLWLCNIIVLFILRIPGSMGSMVMCVVYIWCQLNKEVIVSFWFGTQFKAMYIPWAILLFNWIVHKTFQEDLCGIVIGHLYYFLVFKYPQDFDGVRLLNTPKFLYRYFPNKRRSTSGFGTAPINRRQPSEDTESTTVRNRQVFGGRGNVLGTG
ncbi:unnamed protein product [Adineta steineri]|uniref:Derlin n=1 Tax=Adineta steineri TaxID=433720 RepID=A0A813N781_9BILA|nr:unnamed protein product [Adineta steineri]CAF3875895.1 unnamed protein product [Adineta steineri]